MYLQIPTLRKKSVIIKCKYRCTHFFFIFARYCWVKAKIKWQVTVVISDIKMRLVLLLFLISPIILAENPIIWSLCSRKNHSQWIKHKPRKDHFNFVQAWVKSIYLNNKKSPSKDFKVVSNAYSPNNFELITKIDNSSGT